MIDWESPKAVRIDEAAQSDDPELPAFLARPQDAPVYHGFPLIEETRTEGWYYGAITEFEYPDGCVSGDGFVVAPDGSRAGIVWEVGEQEMATIIPPEADRWGVYAVWFPRATRTVKDMVFNFRHALPDLQQRFHLIDAESREPKMSTKEGFQSALETLDESQLRALYPIGKEFAEAKQAAPQSLISKPRSIQLVDAPEDFATNLDQYMSGEKRVP